MDTYTHHLFNQLEISYKDEIIHDHQNIKDLSFNNVELV